MKNFIRWATLILAIFLVWPGGWARAASDRNPFDLIDEAEKAGELSHARAVLYRSLAFWGDASLPAKFQGNPDAPQERSVPSDLETSSLGSVFNDLDAVEQRQALRMMAPPAYVRGLADGVGIPEDEDDYPTPHPDPAWQKFETTSVIVWYLSTDPNGERYAQTLRDNFDAVVRKLEAFMGRKPLPDDEASYEYVVKGGKKVVIGNGGSGKFDIYVLPVKAGARWRAYTCPYESAALSKGLPAYLVFNSTQNNPIRRIASVLMHETMHAVQFAFPKVAGHIETFPVAEGTAKWSEDHWDSTSQYEHEWPDFFRYGWTSLKAEGYATWTWYYFLVRELPTDTIQSIYSRMAGLHPYDAINAAIPGGFKRMWPEYTRSEWNQLPTEESFAEWDSFGDTPHEAKDKEVEVKPLRIDPGKGEFKEVLNFSLKPLTRKYLAYSVPEGGTARSFSVEMNHYFQKDKIWLKALVNYAGKGWKVEDWNAQGEDKELCLDSSDERIKKIVLIYANFDHSDSAPVSLRAAVKATNLGCKAYKGHITGSMESGSGRSFTKITTDADVWFNVEKRIGDTGMGGHMPGRFALSALKLTYTYKGQANDCTAEKTGTLQLAGPDLAKYGTIGLYPYHTSDNPNGRYFMGSIQHPQKDPLSVTYRCPNGRSYEAKFIVIPWLVGEYGMGRKLIAPGTSALEGSGPVTAPQAGQSVSYTYKLEPFAE